MAWSGGIFTRTNGTYAGSSVWQSDAAAAVKIRADRHDTHDQDLATGINNCLTKDGQNAPTQNISWGAFKITNLGNGSAATDAATYGQTITALGWSGGTITATRAAGDLTLAVTTANITSSLGYTPANKAGDTITGPLVLSSAFTAAPFSVSGALSGAGRNMTFTNTDTSAASTIGFVFTSGASAGSVFGDAAPTYTGVAAFTDRMFFERAGAGIVFSASGASGDHKWYTGAARTLRMTLSSGGDLAVTGAITSGGVEVGYRKVPLTVQNTAYTLVAADAGKGIQHTDTTARTYTANNSVFAAGDVVTILNDTGTGAVTIAAGAGVTLYLAGTTTTGNRTVAVRGLATIFFASASVAYVSGPGVS